MRRAEDILNSDGSNRLQLERLAALFRDRLSKPEIVHGYVDQSGEAELNRAKNRAVVLEDGEGGWSP